LGAATSVAAPCRSSGHADPARPPRSPRGLGAGRRAGGDGRPRMTVPLILDVDTGIDDSLALLYACASPEAELLAVTCVAGNVEARQVAANTLAVLELAGRADVPVHLGAERPLVKPLVTTPE